MSQMNIEKITSSLRGTLDIAETMKLGLTFILETVGPSNAIIYLPSEFNSWCTAAYTSWSVRTAGLVAIADDLSDNLCEKIVEYPQMAFYNSIQDAEEFFQKDLSCLRNKELNYLGSKEYIITATGMANTEIMFVLFLFRDKPFDETQSAKEKLFKVNKALADQIQRITKIHYRMNSFDDISQ